MTGINLFTNNLLAVQKPGMTLVMSGLTLAIYWVGAYLIDAATVPERMGLVTDMLVFSSYAMQIIQAFMMLTMTFIILPRAAVSARRVNEVLDTEPVMKDGAMDGMGLIARGEIEFDHVSFRYPGAEDDVLRDVSFTIGRGETVALIGSTGSGKSTLLNLVPRFYDATEGAVRVDGVDVRHYSQEALRNKLGYVPQRAVMFRGTVASNVAYGSNGRSQVAQGGTNLSGGQKQRLSIARAVCRHPEIYLFDDSFSARGYQTDRATKAAGGNSILSGRLDMMTEYDKMNIKGLLPPGGDAVLRTTGVTGKQICPHFPRGSLPVGKRPICSGRVHIICIM